LRKVADLEPVAIELLGEQADVVSETGKALVEPPRIMVAAEERQAVRESEAGGREAPSAPTRPSTPGLSSR
jgi:hypothetical protein